MKISTVNYFIGDAFKSFKRNKTISIATIITVLVTFIVLGVFSLVAENLNLAIGGLEDKIELVVYLDNDITPIDKKEIQVKINSQQGVKEIQYESREDAFKKLQKITEEFIVEENNIDNINKETEEVKDNSEIKNPFYKDTAYRSWYPIDAEKLDKAAKDFVGTHDFKAMCSTDCTKENTVRTIYYFNVRREGDLIFFNVSFKSFKISVRSSAIPFYSSIIYPLSFEEPNH